MVVAAVVQLLVAVVLFCLGRWIAPRLADARPIGMDEDAWLRRDVVLRRGGVACQVAAAAFVLMIVPMVL